ncbi:MULTISPECIES: MarR family winged helix-turn-helix transcriptional regulator [Streptomyces]|uniref:MarR family winged helix-turn-helix transcriptional regulator n=1 Tax=Streptomyces koelreuteriae TaxID=2838015 RepID=A0ABX8G1L1_9ACTN|nr:MULTISPECIES: MarR family winged helix-turn-helix transcriptional regulator [Streptomyces]QWB27241.1 MarR family winged helix-turn-helix transcriptional regulator [Streptomyces koelreuteriae]UUA10325.1 MarR family winged helix-turn-helix transcriptional regulator [Streptomyces koelreuteriae]UUA17932.1 MarR family winged helix-turn-helix transcriptional regulator [Streptomyces sp. CRCS-T-1]
MSGSGTPSTPLPGDDPTGLQSFAVLLRRMNGEFNRIAHEFAQAHGLHLTDIQALIAILDADPDGVGEPMTPTNLRRQLNLTSGAVTACLDRLEKAGHIRRVRAADDRRVVHLHFAEAARGLAREYFRPLARSTDTARARFTPEELAVIARFLTEMNQELVLLRRDRG